VYWAALKRIFHQALRLTMSPMVEATAKTNTAGTMPKLSSRANAKVVEVVMPLSASPRGTLSGYSSPKITNTTKKANSQEKAAGSRVPSSVSSPARVLSPRMETTAQ
jgi:hypothetical protein